ncbi:MAG: HAD-IA family hydrolase [Burkholderiales bacterium]|jgi:phosphoglycolate phosphatase|nr:HAD-IA family hydrolase [Burkholderiales bacterium]
MISILLFDFDGTLADTATDLVNAVNHVREQRNLPPLPIEELRHFSSGGAAALLKAGLNIAPDDPEFEDARQSFLDHYTAHFTENTKFFPGISDLLKRIEGKGMTWGIVTNRLTKLTTPLLEHLKISTRAAVVVCGDTTDYPKPSPLPIWHAMKHLHAKAKQCVYIGDDYRDVIAAHKAGIRSVSVRWGYRAKNDFVDRWNSDYCIKQPHEIWAVLEKIKAYYAEK